MDVTLLYSESTMQSNATLPLENVLEESQERGREHAKSVYALLTGGRNEDLEHIPLDVEFFCAISTFISIPHTTRVDLIFQISKK
jgi:hypothetical protein